jgi:GntR family transcriptional regulator, galactonate operon transcriptional repressor
MQAANGGRRRRTLHMQIVDELGARIVRGDYAVGGTLPTEPILAAELGVSRNLLREAIKVLAGKGLLEIRPKSGMRVRPQTVWNLLDPDLLGWLDAVGQTLGRSFDLVEFRLIVEPSASFLAARRATPGQRRRILDDCTALEACVGRAELVPEADLAFHRGIFEASGNAILAHLGGLIASLMQIQVVATTERPGSFESGLPLHRALALAIDAHDAGAARDLSRRLVEMPYGDLADRLELDASARLANSVRAARPRRKADPDAA